MKESKKIEVSPIRKMRWMWNGNKERGVVLERVREWEEGRWCCGGTMAQLNSVRKMILDALNDGCNRSCHVAIKGSWFS